MRPSEHVAEKQLGGAGASPHKWAHRVADTRHAWTLQPRPANGLGAACEQRSSHSTPQVFPGPYRGCRERTRLSRETDVLHTAPRSVTGPLGGWLTGAGMSGSLLPEDGLPSAQKTLRVQEVWGTVAP